jgi:hypothetical protein
MMDNKTGWIELKEKFNKPEIAPTKELNRAGPTLER